MHLSFGIFPTNLAINLFSAAKCSILKIANIFLNSAGMGVMALYINEVKITLLFDKNTLNNFMP